MDVFPSTRPRGYNFVFPFRLPLRVRDYTCLFSSIIIIITCLNFHHLCLCHRVVNEPLEIISSDLGFSGDTLAEGIITSAFCFSWRIDSLVITTSTFLIYNNFYVASYVKVWWLVYVSVAHLSDLYSAGELPMDLDGGEPFNFVLYL